ncbi:MAG: hypothetical protein GY826_33955 [Fuerstiella sp.]|nr:hypothetical protein [Fuerstiella sp.]
MVKEKKRAQKQRQDTEIAHLSQTTLMRGWLGTARRQPLLIGDILGSIAKPIIIGIAVSITIDIALVMSSVSNGCYPYISIDVSIGSVAVHAGIGVRDGSSRGHCCDGLLTLVVHRRLQ